MLLDECITLRLVIKLLHGGVDLQHHPQGAAARAPAAALQVQVPARHPAHRLHLLPQHHFQARSTHRPTQVANLSGEFAPGLQAHTEYGNRSTLGYLKHDRRPSPEHFRKKHTGTMGNNSLPPLRNFSYDCAHKKAAVPRAHEKPALGLSSGKNFVVANAVETILSSARRAEEAASWLEKKDYGRVPQYLSKIKASIHEEYRMIQSLHEQG